MARFERQVGGGSASFLWLSCCWFLVLGVEAPFAEQQKRKVEEGRAAVPKREERRGLAKSLMRTGRCCAVVWYGYSTSSPGAGQCAGLDEAGGGGPGDANWQLQLLARTGCRRDDGRYLFPLHYRNCVAAHGCDRSNVAVGWRERLLANVPVPDSDLGVLQSLNLSISLRPCLSDHPPPLSRSAFHKPP